MFVDDKSARTKQISYYNAAFLVAVGCFVIGIVWMAIGFAQFGVMVKHSSTKLGTEMKFERSDATATLEDIYTDSDNSVLIARISTDAQGTVNLPYKGSDFKVFIQNRQLDDREREQMQVLFGRYGTNGDMFLIIPQPNNDVYTAFIANTHFVATDNLVANADSATSQRSAPVSTTGTSDLSDTEMSSILAQSLNDYKTSHQNDGTDNGDALTIQSDLMDVIGFQVTTDPFIETDDYRPKVINAKLLDDDGTFDFETFFNAVFKDNATTDVSSRVAELNQRKELLNERLTDLNERLAKNPTDTDVQQRINSVNNELSTIQSTLDQLSEEYSGITSVKYSSSMFQDMQTEATIITPDMAKQL